MSAYDIARTAHEMALAAAAAVRQEEEERQAAAKSEQAARTARKLAAGTAILNGWFPGVEWQILDDGESLYYSALVVQEAGATWDDPLKLRIDHYLIQDEVYRTRIYAVKQTHSNGYACWEGPEVKSAADVGRWLVAQESAS